MSSEPLEAEGVPAPHPPEHPFLIVGVGASAGGMEAFTELLAALPDEPGIAVLYVQHLEPHHKSLLPELLGKVTRMPVRNAIEGAPIAPNHVYVLPPNANMALTDGSLRLTPRSGGPVPHMPIDYLFRSLAEIQRNRAVGVILSGGGTDGTLGFQSIKAEGGITLAQDEKTAKHGSMPRSAVNYGYADYVLPPREIARRLVQLATHPYARTPPAEEADALPVEADSVVGRILDLVRAATSSDFSQYKRTTLNRRIQRRMAVRGVENVGDYLAYLEGDPAEVHALQQDFLIRVTRFFRDPDVFEILKARVFPALIRDRPADSPIRVWVAGCSTGEEVYSLAICLLEYLGEQSRQPVLKLLATDISESALERARAGVYIDNIEMDIAPERLRRFFTKIEGSYQISKAVREVCIFSKHNMASDPPFSRVDLVSCRNVLIYMSLALQRRILTVFHYALNPGGFLVLGPTENAGTPPDLFAPLEHRHRVFVRNSVPARLSLDFTARVAGTWEGRPSPREAARGVLNALDTQKEADRIVLALYGPVGVVIDENLTVLQFRGRTGPYLEPSPGLASLDLLKMVREGLLGEVRAAVNKARTEKVRVRAEDAHIHHPDTGALRKVHIEVVPFKAPPTGARCFLVLFEDVKPAAPLGGGDGPDAAAAAPEPQAEQLKQEMTALREYLQSVIEEYEVTNEELKSASEEIMSANEELQSTNEELQTAKEETQSANEELATVNDELQHRNMQLAQVNNDLVNLLGGVNIPIVMVSRDLRIRRFTPQAEPLLNLIPTDIGRPISDIKTNLEVGDLAGLIAAVIDKLVPHESQVRDREGRWFSLRIRPYVTLENRIEGASVVLVDIDALRRDLTAGAERP